MPNNVRTLCALAVGVCQIHDQKGSHIHLRHPEKRPLTIPNHKEVSRGTLIAIIREAGLTPDEFMEML
jgi:predicted RNA binding protein YcfA (HicA-like mRNA interferase family)